jgi:hypothetical protein
MLGELFLGLKFPNTRCWAEPTFSWSSAALRSAPTRSTIPMLRPGRSDTALRTPPRAVWAGLVGPFGFSFSFLVATFFFYGNFYDLFLI